MQNVSLPRWMHRVSQQLLLYALSLPSLPCKQTCGSCSARGAVTGREPSRDHLEMEPRCSCTSGVLSGPSVSTRSSCDNVPAGVSVLVGPGGPVSPSPPPAKKVAAAGASTSSLSNRAPPTLLERSTAAVEVGRGLSGRLTPLPTVLPVVCRLLLLIPGLTQLGAYARAATDPPFFFRVYAFDPCTARDLVGVHTHLPAQIRIQTSG